MTTTTFELLSRQSKIAHLRRLARTALESYGLARGKLSLVRYRVNTVYKVEADKRYTLRLNHPAIRTPAQINSGLEWMVALGHETEVIVPEVVPNQTGKLLTTVIDPDVPDPRHAIVFGWLEGRSVLKRPSSNLLYRQGELMARLHRHSASFKLSAQATPRLLATVWPFGLPESVYSEEPNEVFTPARRQMTRQLAIRVEAELDRLVRQGYTRQMLHGDMNLSNLLLHQGKIGLLDFDDCGFGYALQDIGIALYYLDRDQRYPEWLKAFKAGYSSVLEWPEEYEGQLEVFKLARQLELLNYLANTDLPQVKTILPQWVEWAIPQMKKWRELLSK